MKIQSLLVFDIGKTNKKALVFDSGMNILHTEERKFKEITDDDGYPCDDIKGLETWMFESLRKLIHDDRFEIKAVNFATYGATLMYVDSHGQRVTPVYNYLKPLPEGIASDLYNRYGGVEEFSRRTASPALGMLNSGLQILWLKKYKSDLYKQVHGIMHFPQYLSFLFTGKLISERTSIGCHTVLWDFDHMTYHPWTKDEGIALPSPSPVDTFFPVSFDGEKFMTGIGIHDSSSSLVPYFQFSGEKFILISSGTWCINMNPFNNTPLTADQLQKDCLCYMSYEGKPVKSSRVFLGHLHDLNVNALTKYFKVPEDAFKKVKADEAILRKILNRPFGSRVFFNKGVSYDLPDTSVDLSKFSSFEEAYHQLMADLTTLVADSIRLILSDRDDTKHIYVSGGFAHNAIFTRLLASTFRDKEVYISEVAEATALGAALIGRRFLTDTADCKVDLGLEQQFPVSI